MSCVKSHNSVPNRGFFGFLPCGSLNTTQDTQSTSHHPASHSDFEQENGTPMTQWSLLHASSPRPRPGPPPRARKPPRAPPSTGAPWRVNGPHSVCDRWYAIQFGKDGFWYTEHYCNCGPLYLPGPPPPTPFTPSRRPFLGKELRRPRGPHRELCGHPIGGSMECWRREGAAGPSSCAVVPRPLFWL
jgi:hypothetical protein